VGIIGELFPESATSGVQVVGRPDFLLASNVVAVEAVDVALWIHMDVNFLTGTKGSFRWWTGHSWAPLYVNAGVDRPGAVGVDGPGHWHSHVPLPIPVSMAMEVDGYVYDLGRRPMGFSGSSLALFVDPDGTIGGNVAMDIYDTTFAALASVASAPPVSVGVLAVSDVASAANLATVDTVVDTIDGKLTAERLGKIDLIGTGAAATGGGPVSDAGALSEIIIGDDYSTANGNVFAWTVTLPTGATIAGARCYFGGRHSDPSLADENGWTVEGVVSEGPTASQAVITFSLLRSHTSGLVAGDYNWSAEIWNDAGLQSTRVRSKKTRRVTLVEKQTV
jgi:hypothetical protein